MQTGSQKSEHNFSRTIGALHLESLAFEDIHNIRNLLNGWLSDCQADGFLRDRLLLSATEALSNLVQHPLTAPTLIRITLQTEPGRFALDIADNGPVFASFDAECAKSLDCILRRKLGISGRGLGLISLQHPARRYIPAGQSPDRLNHFYIPDTISPLRKSVGAAFPANQKKLKRKIFVVDDDESLRFMIETALEKDAKIICFDSAENALRDFSSEKPDLVISDLHMPGMDGLMLRRTLSALEGGNTTPFVFISGDKDAANSDYISEMGIDDFLTKPVPHQKLRAVVRRLLLRSEQIHEHFKGAFGRDVAQILTPALPEKLGNWKTLVKNHCAEIGGGDFIYHQSKKNGHSVVLADVMGHGLNAKFFACAYAGYLRSLFHVFEKEEAPDTFLSKLSVAVGSDPFLETTIVTCLALWLSDDGHVRVASAGHPAPLICTEGTTDYMDTAGPLPGLGGNAHYRACQQRLQPGERIILFTDGLVENTKNPASLSLGKTCLAETVLECKTDPIEKLSEKIWQNFKTRAGPSGFTDDTTLIVLEYQGENLT